MIWPIAWRKLPTSCSDFLTISFRSEGSRHSRSTFVILSAAKDLCVSINRPSSASVAAIGRFHPCGRPGIRSEYFPGRTPRHLRIQAEYGRHPTGSAYSPTSIPNTRAWFFDWIRGHASIDETPQPNRCGTVRNGRDRAQTPGREDSRGLSAASTRARNSRCRMCAAGLALRSNTSGTTPARSALSEVRHGQHGRPASFAACSSLSSLLVEWLARADF